MSHPQFSSKSPTLARSGASSKSQTMVLIPIWWTGPGKLGVNSFTCPWRWSNNTQTHRKLTKAMEADLESRKVLFLIGVITIIFTIFPCLSRTATNGLTCLPNAGKFTINIAKSWTKLYTQNSVLNSTYMQVKRSVIILR